MARVRSSSQFKKRSVTHKHRPRTTTDPLPDSLTAAESALLDDAIESNRLALMSTTSHLSDSDESITYPSSDSEDPIDWFDTTMPDERSLDDLINSDIPVDVPKVACAARIVQRAQLSDLKPIINTKGKQYTIFIDYYENKYVDIVLTYVRINATYVCQHDVSITTRNIHWLSLLVLIYFLFPFYTFIIIFYIRKDIYIFIYLIYCV